MKYPSEFKDKIISEYRNSSVTRKNLSNKYNIPFETLKDWLKKSHVNRKSNICVDGKNRKVNFKFDFKHMSREELQKEIIKRDFQISRLKKKFPWLNNTDDTE